MPWRVTTWSGVLLIINLGVHLTCGQVYLNEVVATSAERTLQRASGQYPWIGNTTSWPSLAYDDSQWRSGPGPFGFGSFSGVTLGTDVAGMVKQRAASLYLRKSFSVTAAQAASGAALFFTLRYNDGFIAFLNGREIARRNMGNPGMFAFHDQTAFNPRSTTAAAETINIGAANTQLIEGENVLCVQVHNQAVGGSVGDTLLFLADLQLVGGATLVTQGSDWKYFPGLVEPSGGVLDYGFHEASFSLTLSTTPSDAEIRYTLDGSEPNPGLLYTGPLSITTDQIVRARAVRSGAAPSRIVTHTYLMQETAAKKSLAALCLGGDPALTYYGPNASGGPALGEGIFAIKGGTYVAGTWTANNDTAAFNFPMLLGRASEKPGTLEFYPLNGEPLRTDLGVRLSGSPYSRPRYTLTDAPSARFTPSFMRKPSFNLYFRSEWGERPQEYPFFADAATTRFKDIRVRAGKNDIQNPFILDEWVRRLFIAMGQQGSLGTFNTLYINGVFKGYYNLCEHLREAFMQEHYQSSEAWDVQQVNDFTSGNATHWKKTLAYVRGANLSDPEAYRQVSDYLEVDNYIDYLILNSFSAMWDWPNNNWVAARERSESGRWRFYVWDAEGSFGQSGRNPDYNSFTSDLIIGNAGTTGDNYIPALYTLLRVSPEFRLRFADRVQKHFFNDGALVSTNIQAIYQTLRAAINPIMLEVQGSAVNDSFYNAWIVNDTRRDIYFTQLSAQNLWPSLIAPSLSHLGGVVASGLALNLSNPNGYGTIYFTTDGTDPRALGGAIAGTAYTNPITIQQTTTVQARVRSESGDWSPVIVASFIVPTSVPVFLPTGSGDWTVDDNWSSAPLPYPNDIGQAVAIPPADADRNVNLRAPVTVGVIQFPQGEATTRNRVRDQGTDNSLTFQQTNGPALIEVGGDGSGYVEFDVGAGVNLQSDLQLTVTNLVGDADYGALRLRNNWSGPGGLIKAGLGIASLTGDAKTYTGSTVIEQGVLQVTGPAAPIASSSVSVQSGGQLRLTSGSDPGEPRLYTFGGPISLAGAGRGAEISEGQAQGRLGALRYDPGSGNNQALLTNSIVLTAPSEVHVAGSRNRLTLAGAVSGAQPLTKSGGGTLELAANDPVSIGAIQVDNGSLLLSGDVEAPINVAAPALLTGAGSAGALSGTGTLCLEEILSAPSITGLTQQFVFTKTGSPNYGQTPIANGVLLLANPPTAVAAIEVFLPVAPAPDARFRGGYFLPYALDLSAAVTAAPQHVWVLDPEGSRQFKDQTWSELGTVQITTVAEAADFGGGQVFGRTLEVRVEGAPVSFAAWQAAAFPDPADLADPEIAGPGADPLHSGVSNLLRYALGLGLTDNPAERAPQFVGSASAPAIRFPFDSGRNDIAYVVESVFDVTDWSNATVLFDSRADFPPATESGWITIHDPAPSTQQRFYRLKIIPLPPG